MTMAPQHPDAPPGDRTDPWRHTRARHRHPHPHRAPAAAAPSTPPALADGVTLVGEFEGTGYVRPHYLARKANGSVVQISELLYLVADSCDGRRELPQIAEQVSERCGKQVSTDNVTTLLDKLRPLGVVTAADGSSPAVEEVDPFLALRFRTSLVSERGTQLLTLPFRPLFWLPIVLLTVAGLVAYDLWLFFQHGLAQGLRESLNKPATFVLVAGLVVLSAAFHEIGHATACAVGGARPGRMGAGVYLAWPAFYTDVTEAYTLDRRGRLRTDLGGIYFNALFVLGLGLAWRLTGFEPLLLVSFLLQIEIVHQMLPFLRLDGYYVLSDIAGVPDLFRRIGPVLRSALPGHEPDESVQELKRWVRVLVTGWVLVVVPLLLLNLGMIVLNAPRILATSWDSGAKLVYQLGHSGGLGAVAAGVQLLFLAIPVLGLLLTFSKMGGRAAAGSWTWSRGSAPKRSLVLVAATGLTVLLVAAWMPDGRTTPYRQGERGTFAQGASSLRYVGQGHPELRAPRQAATEPLPTAAPGTTAGELARTPVTTAPQATSTPSAQATTPTAATPSPVATASTSPTSSPSASASPVATTSTTSTPSATASATPSATPSPSPAATP